MQSESVKTGYDIRQLQAETHNNKKDERNILCDYSENRVLDTEAVVRQQFRWGYWFWFWQYPATTERQIAENGSRHFGKSSKNGWSIICPFLKEYHSRRLHDDINDNKRAKEDKSLKKARFKQYGLPQWGTYPALSRYPLKSPHDKMKDMQQSWRAISELLKMTTAFSWICSKRHKRRSDCRYWGWKSVRQQDKD